MEATLFTQAKLPSAQPIPAKAKFDIQAYLDARNKVLANQYPEDKELTEKIKQPIS